MSGVHLGGAAESDRDALRPHLPAEEQVPGDHRLLQELHRRGGRSRGHLLLRPDGHPSPMGNPMARPNYFFPHNFL